MNYKGFVITVGAIYYSQNDCYDGFIARMSGATIVAPLFEPLYLEGIEQAIDEFLNGEIQF